MLQRLCENRTSMIELNGHSGCKIYVIDEYSRKVVRKVSSSEEYNERLLAQMRKQENLILPGFKTCEVLGNGKVNNLFYFDMEYLNGKTLAENIETLSLNNVIKIASILSGNIVTYESPNEEADYFFKEKINSLKLDDRVKNKAIVQKGLRYVNNYSWKYVMHSHCHGDLTLENIIVQNNDFYLIDCLDSFYDSWLIDIAKIFQDVDLFWSYRNQENINENLLIRLTVIRDLLMDKILGMPMGKEILDTIYHILIVNLLRIYPYVSDAKTELFLDEKLGYVINKIG